MKLTPEEKLIAGIIHQALKDTKHPDKEIREDALEFFNSGACFRLTGVSGSRMLSMYNKYGTVKGEFEESVKAKKMHKCIDIAERDNND